jgi:hypothetical protein
MLCVLTLTSFFIPFGPEMQIGISIMLAFSVFKLRLSDDVPVQSDNIPLINIYFTMCMTFSLSAMIWFSIINRCREKNRVPTYVRFIVVNYICFLMCDFKHANKSKPNIDKTSTVKLKNKKNKKKQTNKSISFEDSNKETLLPKLLQKTTNSSINLAQNREALVQNSSSSPLNNTSTYDSSTLSITSNAKQSYNNKASLKNCATFNSLDFSNLNSFNDTNIEIYKKIPITFQKNENLNKRRSHQNNILKAPIYLDNEDEFFEELHASNNKQASKLIWYRKYEKFSGN